MFRLTGMELGKLWGKRNFLLSCLALFVLDLFLLWYTNLPGEEKPGLASYGCFQKEIAGMTEQEKADYLMELKETIDGVGFVQEIISLQSLQNTTGETLAAQYRESAPGLFEAYYDRYQDGSYLRLTDSYWKERQLIEEFYEEWEQCAGYEQYLQSVQETKNTLSTIGIFAGTQQDSFSARNVRKSAEDYAGLTGENICWMPGHGIVRAMENVWTDILLLLSVFFFVGSLILGEKEKKLFYITRSTRYGMGRSIGSKLATLWIHCMTMTVLLYGMNLTFFGSLMGYGDLGASLQSVAAWRESPLSITILSYLLLSIFTKGIVVFGFGALLTAFCIAADTVSLPYGIGLLLCGGSWFLYIVIPAASKGNLFKYLNLAVILKTEHFYGAYLNFDLFGYPLSRMLLTWILILMLTGTGILGSVYFYLRGNHFVLRERGWPSLTCFRPHASLAGHEGYKIFITKKALPVLLVFGFLAAYREWEQVYRISVQEEYYQKLMLHLEGELTQEKEALILSEQARFQEAFDRIAEIDEMVAAGEISERAGEDWKMEYSAVTAFYPSFTRVLQQYEQVCHDGGQFVYDTGYLYLFGVMGEDGLVDLLLLCCGVVLAFGDVAAMEDVGGTWNLLGSTRRGKRSILVCKLGLSMGAAGVLALVPFFSRAVRICSVFPMEGAGIRDIPCFHGFALALPIWGFVLLAALSQAGVLAGAGALIFGLSCWRKEPMQACFFGALLLLIPLLLLQLGFSAAEMFSIYPLYSWIARGGIM